MSLAPASSLGAFLKARLAVNGIQCAARSFGTLTAAGRGLLSSMGASSGVGVWRLWCQAISFVAGRKPTTPVGSGQFDCGGLPGWKTRDSERIFGECE